LESQETIVSKNFLGVKFKKVESILNKASDILIAEEGAGARKRPPEVGC
jgi:hypothetical protein